MEQTAAPYFKAQLRLTAWKAASRWRDRVGHLAPAFSMRLESAGPVLQPAPFLLLTLSALGKPGAMVG